jgi:outer membrane protein assembly factor BamB
VKHAVTCAAALLGAVLSQCRPALASGPHFNQPGNLLISDQFNNRVIEVTPKGDIAWSFGTGGPSQCAAGPGTVIAPNDVERLAKGWTLIAGTGTASCPDNRVLIVDRAGQILFQYGQAGVAGSGPNQLNTPVFAAQTPDGDILITDQGNNRILRVSLRGVIRYQYGPASGPGALNAPNSAELLPDGHVLIADENNNRVIEVDPSHGNRITFEYKHNLQTVAFASRLPNGNTLIADSGHNRIVEINPKSEVVFTYATNGGQGSNANPNPTGALRLRNRNLLIADQFNDRVIIVSPLKKLLFQYGTLNVAGDGPNQLDAPYSAMAIGDYTGVMKPPGL